MKPFAVICFALMLFAACGQLSPEEKALRDAKESAQESYEYLLRGKYDRFLKGRAGMDSIDDNYREQLLVSYKQFISRQQKAHGGIGSFTVSNARMDSTQQLIQVFLILNYNDSTREEIVVPMVEDGGAWKMK